jgi:GT2 family glycosyltransferase
MDKIRASIVTFNTDQLLLRAAIESFSRCSLAGLLTIIDNSPNDSLRKHCELPNVEYFFNGSNVGYGRAHNFAMTESLDKAQYHLVLNPDVSFDPSVLEQLYHFMESRLEAGLVMPRVIGPDGQLQMLCKLLPTPFDLASRRFFPFKNWLRKLNDRYEMNDSGYNTVMNVPFLSGCFMFFRTEALKKVGLFDDRYFLYAEDTDLSRRMHLQFQTLFYPHVHITHVHARGSYKDFSLTLQNIKSACQYFNKWGWWFDEERKQINERALLASSNSEMEQKQSLREVSAA